jgi:hypothetical protein
MTRPTVRPMGPRFYVGQTVSVRVSWPGVPQGTGVVRAIHQAPGRLSYLVEFPALGLKRELIGWMLAPVEEPPPLPPCD